MKLKFRADSKDIKIFIIFAIIWFYFISIIILNLTVFTQSSELHGFNPLPVFSADLFPTIFIMYIASVLMIMLSVQSYFFDREKGIGLISGKKEDTGYSRWATNKEMQKELKKVNPKSDTLESAGIPFINNDKEMWVDDGGYHSLIIGSTGAGKTQLIVHPMMKILAKNSESMIVTDPKGEIYLESVNELKERGYEIVVLNFREPKKGNAWNPMVLPYEIYKNGDKDKAIGLVDDLAVNIMHDDSGEGKDPFWENSSASYFSGLTLALFEDAKPEEVNLNSINTLTTIGEQKINGSTYVKQYFDSKNQDGIAYTNASGTLQAPNDTKNSILSVFKQKIKVFTTRESISEMLSYSDFDMRDIGRKKTAVFLIVQDEKKTYHPLVTIFLKQCYESLVEVAQESPGGKLKHRTNFIMDEFANMPPVKDFDAMISAARSRNIRLNMIIQNFSQLTEVYGKSTGETIRGNCGNLIYLISTEVAALEEISKMCGDKKSKKDDKTASTPLITVSELQRLKEGEAIILRLRTNPFKTKLKHNYKMIKENAWGKNYDLGTFITREEKQVKTFDVKEIVDEIVKKKREELFGDKKNLQGTNPSIFSSNQQIKKQANKDEVNKKIDEKINQLLSDTSNKNTSNQARNIPKKGDFNIEKLLANLDEKMAALDKEFSGKENKKISPNKFSELSKSENEVIDKKVNKKLPKKVVETNSNIKPSETLKPKKTNNVPKVENKKNMAKAPLEEKKISIKNEKVDIPVDNQFKNVTDDQFFDDFFFDDE